MKETDKSFSDVKEGEYYSKALSWALQQGIVKGTGANEFSPEAICTRAQTVTILYRYAKSPAVNSKHNFVDVNEGTYYSDAVKWAFENGITSGTDINLFSPDAICNRAQIITFLYRYLGR